MSKEQTPKVESYLDRINAFQERAKSNFSPKTLTTMIYFMVFGLAGVAFLFGYLYKNMFLLKAFFVAGMLLLVCLIVAKRIWYPDEDILPQAKETPSNGNKKDDSAGLGSAMSFDFGLEDAGLPNTRDYDKRMEKAFNV